MRVERFVGALVRWAAIVTAVTAAVLAILGGAVLLEPAAALRLLVRLIGLTAAGLGVTALGGLLWGLLRR